MSDDSVELYCRETGDGLPVLLLHGLLGSGGNLGSLARHLQGNYRVLQPDARNHGRSPHTQQMSYRLMIADTIRLLDERGIAQCVVIGHSMGGKVAMGLGLAHPGRIKALAVVDICPIEYPGQRHAAVFDALARLPLASLESRQHADRLLGPAIAEAGLRQFLLTNLYRRDSDYAWRANLDALRDSQAELAGMPAIDGRYTGPVIFIKGADSDYIGEACRQTIERLFPAAVYKIIPGTGHWPHVEKPVLFNGTVSRFLNSSIHAD